MENILHVLYSIVENNITDLKKPISEIGADENLFALGMNSISSIKIVVALEEYFDFEFEDEKLTVDTLHSINSISKYISECVHL